MLNWFRRRSSRTQPEARWLVAADEATLTVTDPAGAAVCLAIADLTAIAIHTTGDGPFATDVWWLLFGPDERITARFPLGATGMDAALDRLGQLPGYDHGATALAMGSTSDAVFTIWRRNG